MKKSIAILGGSATSCILGLLLKKKNYKIDIFEKSNTLGGAWALSNGVPKYSNIIAPLNKKEGNFFPQAKKFFKSYQVNFLKNETKTLYSKKIVSASVCDLNKLYSTANKKLKIKFNFIVKSITAKGNKILINNKLLYDYVFFPTYFPINQIKVKNRNKLNRLISIPYDKLNTAYHIVLIVKNLKKKIKFDKYSLGPLDRFQIIKLKNKDLRIHGRIRRAFKNENKKKIISELKKKVLFENLKFVKIYKYKSCVRKYSQIRYLKNRLDKLNRIFYLNTMSFLDFYRGIKNINFEERLK